MKIYQKLNLFLSGLCLILTLETRAQNAKTDIIIKRDNSKIDALVIEMDEHFIKYKKAENLTGPLYNISKNEVVSILYRNGEVENFATISANVQAATERTVQERPQESRATTDEQPSSAGTILAPANPPRNAFERSVQQTKSDRLRIDYKRYKSKGSHGLVMGIIFTGLGIGAIGAGAILISDPYDYDGYDYDLEYNEEKYYGGIAAMVTGVALAGGLGTIGWIKMARNKSKARVIGNELTRRKESVVSFKVRPGYHVGSKAGYLSVSMRF